MRRYFCGTPGALLPSGRGRQLDQRFRSGSRGGAGIEGLGRAPGIDGGYLVNTGHGAARGAALFCKKFAMALLVSVLHQRDARVSALLRTIMDQAVFANIEIARACAAAPVVFFPARDIVLKFIDPREGLFLERNNLLENFLLAAPRRGVPQPARLQDYARRCLVRN
jgi:hypothetical protein